MFRAFFIILQRDYLQEGEVPFIWSELSLEFSSEIYHWFQCWSIYCLGLIYSFFGQINSILKFLVKLVKSYFVGSLVTMPLKFLKSLFFLLSMVFNAFVIHGGSRDVILLVSWGMKFDKMFRKILVKVLVCQFGSGFLFSC